MVNNQLKNMKKEGSRRKITFEKKKGVSSGFAWIMG